MPRLKLRVRGNCEGHVVVEGDAETAVVDLCAAEPVAQGSDQRGGDGLAAAGYLAGVADQPP
jgi:hypothetical protein